MSSMSSDEFAQTKPCEVEAKLHSPAYELGAFKDTESSKQLEIIDKLRELGVGNDISLPTLVVIGDQSSGKSSLLEGLTGLPFPVAGDLCTRFATEVAFRRTPPGSKEEVLVSIVPAPNTPHELQQSLQKFHRNGAFFTVKGFTRILNNAAKFMGIDSSAGALSTNRFSPHVLRIEVLGPSQQHLSVVDVPGLFHNPQPPKQTIEDMALIRALIDRYVQDPKTIMVAVLDSRVNMANQEVFKLARDADKEGLRTVGVMTKLDVVGPGDETEVMRIARNESHPLRHGWYCVRNRTTTEVSKHVDLAEREQKEIAFFATTPWATLPKSRVGIKSLKLNLGRILADHIRQEFPLIKASINDMLNKALADRSALGQSRSNPRDQASYLTKLAAEFQKYAESELSGRHLERQQNTKSSLRTKVQSAKEKFNGTMLSEGHTLKFLSSEAEHDFTSSTTHVGPSQNSKHGILDKIKEVWRSQRGTELGGQVNPAVIEDLFYFQTQNWHVIAQKDMRTIQELVVTSYESIFNTCCPDTILREKIMDALQSRVDAVASRASDKLAMLLDGEREGPLCTTNHYYAENLGKYRADRVKDTMDKHGLSTGVFGKPSTTINLTGLRSALHIGNEESAQSDIHDSLRAYYRVAAKRFIDNFSVYVVEQELLGKHGILRLFNQEWVDSLDDEEVSALAGEDENTAALRKSLDKQVARLEEAQHLCGSKRKRAVYDERNGTVKSARLDVL